MDVKTMCTRGGILNMINLTMAQDQWDRVRRLLAVALTLGVAVGFWADPVPAANWRPDKPIELIVGTGPGSGVDNTMRTVQAVIQAPHETQMSSLISHTEPEATTLSRDRSVRARPAAP